MLRSALLLVLASTFACAASTSTTEDGATAAASDDLVAGRVGAVYTMSNDAASNAVVVYRRAADGTLQYAASYATTGRGTGDNLMSSGTIAFGTDRNYLFVVSPGSNELSVFHVAGEVLYLVDTVPSGGERPVSVTEHDGLVYVVNEGTGNCITGFRQRANGTLAPIAGSTRSLSGDAVGAAQISFSPSGRALLVTERATNKVDEFRVDLRTGIAGEAVVHDSSGQTPFGFAVTARGQAIVSEAFGGVDGASAVSSYQLGATSGLATVSGSVADHAGAACWVALARSDRFAYVTNTKSGTLSGYTVSASGALALVGSGTAVDLGAGTGPTDLATSRSDRFLYALENGKGRIATLAIQDDGTLVKVAEVTGLPAAVSGLVAQ